MKTTVLDKKKNGIIVRAVGVVIDVEFDLRAITKKSLLVLIIAVRENKVRNNKQAERKRDTG
ncbi:MAG: hypothetical protein ACK2TV_14085 [Anaerolineales bacterium]